MVDAIRAKIAAAPIHGAWCLARRGEAEVIAHLDVCQAELWTLLADDR